MPFPALNPALERALTARAYAEPTAVQIAVLEAEAAGRDLLVSAQTGSGKTVAFGIAVAGRLLGDNERFERAAEPLALIVAPTRELAMQVQRELEWLYAETQAKIASCVGGMDPRLERIALAEGAHIVVGTPGRLRDHLERGRLDMTKLRTVVLDEADEMLDLGFREDLEFILDATPAERQTLMFSATVPREIEALARRYQRDAFRIETAVRNQQHEDIEYRAIRTQPNAIEQTVVNLLRFHASPATLVFCATRDGVRRLHAGLANRGFMAVALSGELSQMERTDALQSLRDGRSKVLVATDVAARGLDLPELALVIHADLPNDRETLLHRSGRTGRAGRKGMSVLIVPPNRRRRAEELLGRARISAAWGTAPSAKDITTKDHERLMALPILDELATAEDLALGRQLLEGRTPEQVAAALIRMHRAGLPVPEDIKDGGRGAGHDRATPGGRGERAESSWGDRRPDRAQRSERPDRPDRGERPERRERPERSRPDQGPMVWFALSIGRDKNADPRWLLPLICRAGDVTKAEIGSIKVGDTETKFQIATEHADAFAIAAKNAKTKEGHIWRVDGEAAPSRPARPSRPEADDERRSERKAPRAPRKLEAHAPPHTSEIEATPAETIAPAAAAIEAAPARMADPVPLDVSTAPATQVVDSGDTQSVAAEPAELPIAAAIAPALPREPGEAPALRLDIGEIATERPRTDERPERGAFGGGTDVLKRRQDKPERARPPHRDKTDTAPARERKPYDGAKKPFDRAKPFAGGERRSFNGPRGDAPRADDRRGAAPRGDDTRNGYRTDKPDRERTGAARGPDRAAGGRPAPWQDRSRGADRAAPSGAGAGPRPDAGAASGERKPYNSRGGARGDDRYKDRSAGERASGSRGASHDRAGKDRAGGAFKRNERHEAAPRAPRVADPAKALDPNVRKPFGYRRARPDAGGEATARGPSAGAAPKAARHEGSRSAGPARDSAREGAREGARPERKRFNDKAGGKPWQGGARSEGPGAKKPFHASKGFKPGGRPPQRDGRPGGGAGGKPTGGQRPFKPGFKKRGQP